MQENLIKDIEEKLIPLGFTLSGDKKSLSHESADFINVELDNVKDIKKALSFFFNEIYAWGFDDGINSDTPHDWDN